MASVNVTVSSQTTTTKVQPSIRYDPFYLKTLPGLLKVAEVIVSLVGFISVQCAPLSAYRSAGGWYSFVSMTAFWVTLVLIVFYVFHVIERLHMLPWLLIELVYAAVWTVLYFVAACVVAARGGEDPAWGAAAFFAFLAMIIFGFEAYRKFLSWRAGDIAQGERTTTANTETTTTTGPSYPTY